ncbi:hypothetical protein, partial [Actinomycetospora sp.]|uniref:hypothetical protein n=1 Tax=Actinomycetospora sp. TaxID=1872135 RepID=UPI002F3FCA51
LSDVLDGQVQRAGLVVVLVVDGHHRSPAGQELLLDLADRGARFAELDAMASATRAGTRGIWRRERRSDSAGWATTEGG